MKEKIGKKLLEFYDKNRRQMPWREDPRPYYVWISEIMLQQTRVEAVREYFRKFIESFPTIDSLAESEEEKLLKVWQGLGYYQRARNLKKAAEMIMTEFHGKIPSTKEELLQLPGIGEYTAGAILSIAFSEVEVAIDGNVIRVFSRYLGSDADYSKRKNLNLLRDEILCHMPEERPGDFNQALMELGATICIPNGNPKCDECPIAEGCSGYRNNNMMKYPLRKKKIVRKIEEKTVLVVRKEDRVLIEQRVGETLLSGFWQFPMLEGIRSQQEIEEKFAGQSGVVREIGRGKHIFTNREWHMCGYEVTLPEEFKETDGEYLLNRRFVSLEELQEKYPIPHAFSTFLKELF